MPRAKEKNEEIRKQRYQEILQSAILVYAEKGYAASEIGEIAERAGIARGLVYHYFKSKQILFRELYEYMMEQSRLFTQSHFEQDGSSFDLVSEYVRLVCERVLEEPAVSRFYNRISMDVHYLYSEEQFSPFDWVKSFLQPMARAIEEGIQQQTVRPGVPNLMAMQFWGTISQGMYYLDQQQQELLSQGISKTEIKEQLMPVMKQVIESALAVIRA